jgi:hypothetical protein
MPRCSIVAPVPDAASSGSRCSTLTPSAARNLAAARRLDYPTGNLLCHTTTRLLVEPLRASAASSWHLPTALDAV